MNIPSHLRFLMAGIQDRATDLALQGHTSVRCELDVGQGYAVFELVTRPGCCATTSKDTTRITASLREVMFPSASGMTVAEASSEARANLGAMLDHLNALMANEGATPCA
ncbi:hypothetical protein [Halomonas organivorans]|uniref:Uncharacterized protein n=1 Tax=Halomonas organivorans TaxID=257772 RepID=A0A7W5C0N5_9GAMM|nr:hypothetical protein [Halomonas organivorans]MBB3142224.1 hypothetical protein [Halomonas organivorans]